MKGRKLFPAFLIAVFGSIQQGVHRVEQCTVSLSTQRYPRSALSIYDLFKFGFPLCFFGREGVHSEVHWDPLLHLSGPANWNPAGSCLETHSAFPLGGSGNMRVSGFCRRNELQEGQEEF